MMDSFELNKLIGAFLGVVFVVFSVSLLSSAIFSQHAPERPGYAIEVAEETPDTGGEAEAGPTIAELLQTADPAAGETAFRKCVACHTPEQGGSNKIGPNLWNIVNRPVATHPGFNYSAAMRGFAEDGKVWDYHHLSEFLKAPRSYVPNTAMAFAGIRNLQEEANLIAYMRTLSDSPAPLPEVQAAPAEEPAEGTVPAQPDTVDDGTSASPEVDPGVPSGEAPSDE